MRNEIIADPFRTPLTPAELAMAAKVVQADPGTERVVMPVPDGITLTNADLQRMTPPGAKLVTGWRYPDAAERLLGCVARFQMPDSSKSYRPIVYVVGADGKGRWAARGFPDPRPLFGLDRLAKNPTADVIVVEGEKKCAAAVEYYTDFVAITSSGGAASAAKSDWSPVRGRRVIILPDNNAAGYRYAEDVARLANAAGALSVRIVTWPANVPDGWDIADPLPIDVEVDFDRVLAEATATIGAAPAAETAGEAEAAAADSEPIPLFPPMPKADPFPIDALGLPLARTARAIAAKVQVPDALAAQSVLSTAALAAQTHADVLLPYGQARPLSCYFVTIAGSGERKSTADNEALWPLAKRERVLREQHADDMKEWRLSYAAWAAEKRKIEANGKLDFEARRNSLKALGDEPEKPLEPFLTTGDLTFEGLAKTMPVAHPSLGIFTAEGGTFTGGHGLSDEARLRTAAALSELWDGKPIKRIRAKDGVSILPGRRVALHVMVQHDVAAQFLGDPLLRDQGLLSRILVVAPDSIAGSRFYREPTMEDEKAIRAFGARILALLEQPAPLAPGTRNELEPRALIISAEATKRWCVFHDWIEAQVGTDGALRPIRDFAAKIAEHAARIAGVLTIFEDSTATTIDVDAMERALEIADFYVSEAVRLAAASRTDPKLLRAQALLDWMTERQLDVISLRDLVRLGPGSLRTKAAMEEALAVLVAHGWTTEVSSRPRTIRFQGR